MNKIKYLIGIVILKTSYDFFMWIYGYFLRYKWVSYFKKMNKSLMCYYYPIINYLNKMPYDAVNSDLYAPYNQKYVENIFIKSHGYYRHLFLQNLNPFYWLKTFIFLPQQLIKYLNVNCKIKTIHFFNFLYWIFGATFTIYNSEITAFIKKLIKLLFEYFSKK